MEVVKTYNCNNPSAEIAAEAKKLVVNINNLLQHGSDRTLDPAYCVDLLCEELVQRYGRERLEQAVLQLFKAEESPAELSAKFTALCQTFNQRYFDNDPRLRGVRVEVRYWLGSQRMETASRGEIRLVASCEAVLVRQLLAAMIFYIDQESDHRRTNEMHLDAAGAPMWVQPQDRHLSAEEFISAVSFEPDAIAQERWLAHIRDSRPVAGQPVSEVSSSGSAAVISPPEGQPPRSARQGT